MSILCVDLGTRFGWALLDEGEVVDSGEANLPPASEPMGVRWAGFRDWFLARIYDGKDRSPLTAMVYEEPFGRYQAVLRVQGGMSTVLELVGEDHGLEYMGLQPSYIKRFATGRGNCKKAEMTKALFDRFEEFGMEPPPPDIGENEVDAIWIALYVAAELTVSGGNP